MKEITFNNLSEGPFTESLLKESWGDVKGIKGIQEGRCSIVNIDGENVLLIKPTKTVFKLFKKCPKINILRGPHESLIKLV